MIADDEEFAREELASVLAGRIRFTKTGTLILDDGFDALTSIQKVACLLLAFRAAEMLGLREKAQATPQELIDTSGMAAGTVRPKLSELAKSRYVTKGPVGYSVPLNASRRVIRLLAGGEN